MTEEHDFSREQRIHALAVKLELGTATAEEWLEAANALSYAAGERLRLEQQLERTRNVVTALAMAYDVVCAELCMGCRSGICSRHQPAAGIVESVQRSAQ